MQKEKKKDQKNEKKVEKEKGKTGMFLNDKRKAVSAAPPAALLYPLTPLAPLCLLGKQLSVPSTISTTWAAAQWEHIPIVAQVTDLVGVPLALPGMAGVPPHPSVQLRRLLLHCHLFHPSFPCCLFGPNMGWQFEFALFLVCYSLP